MGGIFISTHNVDGISFDSLEFGKAPSILWDNLTSINGDFVHVPKTTRT